MTTPRILSLPAVTAVLVVAMTGAPPAAAAPSPVTVAYSPPAAIALPELPGALAGWTLGVNDAGTIVGSSNVATNIHATAWVPVSGGRFTAVDLNPAGTATSRANAINAIGLVAGSAGARAEVWKPDGHGGYAALALGRLPTASSSDPQADGGLAVDRNGVVVGQASAAGGTTHAVLWRPDGRGGYTAPTDLGTLRGDVSSAAAAINATGIVTGGSQNAQHTAQAVVWTSPGTVTAAIAALAGVGTDSEARGIDSTGIVAGLTGQTGTTDLQPVVWRPGPRSGYGSPVPLPAFAGGTPTDVAGISPSGIVTGASFTASFATHATLWVPSRAGAYLPFELGPLPGGTQSEATAASINYAVGTSDVGDFFAHPVAWRLNSAAVSTCQVPADSAFCRARQQMRDA